MDNTIKKFKTKLRHWNKSEKSDRARLLLENNNSDAQDVHRYANPLHHNGFNTTEEQLFLMLLTMSSTANSINLDPDDGWNSGNEIMKQDIDRFIQRFVSQSIPKPPADLDQNLQRHLSHVKEAVFNALEKHGPALSLHGWGCLIDHYHRETFAHLHTLLQTVSSTKNYYVLMDWVANTYLSQEMLHRPDRQLLDHWEAKATEKVLLSVQKEVRELLPKILQAERNQTHHSEEAYVGLYVDIIRYIDAMSKAAHKISPVLHNQVQHFCFQELMTFVRRYTEEQTEVLCKRKETWLKNKEKLETVHFLKTLRTCQELRNYVQTEGKDIKQDLLKDTVGTLESMESFTLKLLMEIVADMAESCFKNYFRSRGRELHLLNDLKTYFPRLSYAADEQKRVMDEAYKLIAHTYLKHLIQNSQHKLKRWNPDIGQTVSTDAHLLHTVISDLAPGVRPWNLILLKIPEVLECRSIDALKIILGNMEKECVEQRDDLKLLPTLLRWKGLSKRDVSEVVDALPSSDHRVISGSCFSCFTCC